MTKPAKMPKNCIIFKMTKRHFCYGSVAFFYADWSVSDIERVFTSSRVCWITVARVIGLNSGMLSSTVTVPSAISASCAMPLVVKIIVSLHALFISSMYGITIPKLALLPIIGIISVFFKSKQLAATSYIGMENAGMFAISLNFSASDFASASSVE